MAGTPPAPPGGALAARILRALGAPRGAAPHVLPSERVTALLVTLPRAAPRQRASLLTFAAEESVGVPIDAVAVAEGPLRGAPPGTHLALLVSRAALAEAAARAPGAQVIPDLLGLRRPEAAGAWAVWREGARVVVRRADGTGFAAAADALPMLWALAGRPALQRLHEALPEGMAAQDLSAAPPAPDPADLAFGFETGLPSDRSRAARRPLVLAAGIVGVALALHLALAGADAVALGRIAGAERARAEAALAPILPGVEIGPDAAPILARLAPVAAAPARSDFLPLLAEASAALAGTGREVGFRRLSWGAEEGTLSLLVQGSALDDLQAAEAGLREAGLTVTSGAASAGEGGAEVEMRVSRGAPAQAAPG